MDYLTLKKQVLNKYFSRTNDMQKKAVFRINGAVLIVAGAGSGKTTVLCNRIANMLLFGNAYNSNTVRELSDDDIAFAQSFLAGEIDNFDAAERLSEIFGEDRVKPWNILAVTFTNKAAAELKERLENMGADVDGIWAATFHSACVRILRQDIEELGMGYKSNFTIYDTDDQLKVIKTVMKEHNISDKAVTPKAVQNLISRSKDKLITPDKFSTKGKNGNDDYQLSTAKTIYTDYQARLEAANALDFDDIIMLTVKLFAHCPDVLSHWQNRFRYIMVDEYQDTNAAQYKLVSLLAEGSGNLCVVGDEDQSIYGFRAAYPEALLSFEKNHKGAKVLLMEENFRSNAKIVEAADKFIQKNTLRHEKHMKPAREAGTDIREISLKSRKAEYVYLMRVAQECMTRESSLQKNGMDARKAETAVLYRDNECAIPLIDLLERKNIPYRMRNAELSFFTHRTVLDVENIIRFAMNPKDTDRFMQIYYRLKLFFRKEDALRYVNLSKEKDMAVLDAVLKYDNLEKYQEDNIRNLRRQMERILKMTGDEAVDQILTYMGYQDYLKKMGMNANKLEIVKMIGSRVDSPEKLLERLEELRKIIREKKTESDCPFILSTMHASKGLEYDTVYLLDVMDGILPEKVLVNPRTASKEELETYEEERRLFYVGVTRAKNQLNVFTTNKPSKFCSELLGKRNLRENRQKEYAGIKKWGDYSPAETYGVKENGMYHGSQKQPGKSYQELADALGEGMIVKHKKFGEGVVVDMEGDHIRIQFGDNVKNMDLKVLARLGMLEI